MSSTVSFVSSILWFKFLNGGEFTTALHLLLQNYFTCFSSSIPAIHLDSAYFFSLATLCSTSFISEISRLSLEITVLKYCICQIVFPLCFLDLSTYTLTSIYPDSPTKQNGKYPKHQKMNKKETNSTKESQREICAHVIRQILWSEGLYEL